MPLAFVKLEAVGNDLILLDGRRIPLPADLPRLAVRLCDRHTGIGSDGLLTLGRMSDGITLMRMFNPDGSEDFCGNALRCTAAYLHEQGESTEERLILYSTRGCHDAILHPQGRGRYEVDVDVLAPVFEPAEVPVDRPSGPVLDQPLRIGEHDLRISCLAVGTTHTVIFREADVPDALFFEVSPVLERHPLFPERTSVLWCRAEGRARIHMRIWERGVGETFGCGSGACAAVVIGRQLGLTADRAEVLTRGGRLVAEWHGREPVRLTGPARIVYAGEWSAPEEGAPAEGEFRA